MHHDDFGIALYAVGLACDEALEKALHDPWDPDDVEHLGEFEGTDLLDVVECVSLDEVEGLEYDTVRQASLRSINYEE